MRKCILHCHFFFFTNSAKLTKLVKEHLGVFLQGAQNLKPEPSHVKEVCFLYVQCREVRKPIVILYSGARVLQLLLNLIYIPKVLLP